jgi:hypothetical protein
MPEPELLLQWDLPAVKVPGADPPCDASKFDPGHWAFAMASSWVSTVVSSFTDVYYILVEDAEQRSICTATHSRAKEKQDRAVGMRQ